MTTIDKLKALPNPFIGINLPPKPARKPAQAAIARTLTHTKPATRDAYVKPAKPKGGKR